MLTASFEYVLPVIRGIQAGREYYVSMCPVRYLPKLFPWEREELPPESRSYRPVHKTRVPQIAQYILSNSENYTFSAITASIDGDITFEPIGHQGDERKIGRLRVPMDAELTIQDGQQRRAAFEIALQQNPDLGYETIAVIFFLDIGLERSQQICRDLNCYAVRPDSSLNILYNHQDDKALLVKAVVQKVPVLRELTEMERSSLSTRSSKLFTLNSLYHATLALLEYPLKAENSVFAQKSDAPELLKLWQSLAVNYWQTVGKQIPDWQLVREKQLSAREIRRDYLHSHTVGLMALGAVGARLIGRYPECWADYLPKLQQLDWSRFNPDWQGKVIFGDRISQSTRSVAWLTGYLEDYLDLPVIRDVDMMGDLVGNMGDRFSGGKEK